MPANHDRFKNPSNHSALQRMIDPAVWLNRESTLRDDIAVRALQLSPKEPSVPMGIALMPSTA